MKLLVTSNKPIYRSEHNGTTINVKVNCGKLSLETVSGSSTPWSQHRSLESSAKRFGSADKQHGCSVHYFVRSYYCSKIRPNFTGVMRIKME